MTPGVYVSGCEPATGKSAVALGVQQLLTRRVERLGIFRPVIAAPEHDPLIDLLRPLGASFLPYEASCGVGYEEVRADEARALEEIVARYRALAAQCDGVLVVGTDFAGTASELAFNARVALNLGLPALLVVSGHGRTPAEIATAIDVSLTTWRRWGPDVVGVVANRVRGFELDAVASSADAMPIYALPEVDLLMAPTVGQVAAACHGTVIAGDAELLGREALHLMVAAMTLPNLMDRITDGAVLITPGDRAEVLLAAMFAHASTSLPSPAGVVLTGGLRPPELILGALGSFGGIVPVVLTEHDTYETVSLASAREGAITRDAPRKITKALALFETHVDGDDLLDRIDVTRSAVVTPLMFEYTLLDRARAAGRHIVLPEGVDERVLRAADILLRRRVVELTLLGPAAEVRGAASRLGLDLYGAHIVDPSEPELLERFAAEYAARRAHKGVTVDQARDVVSDVSYFGTMMVALGMVDGMVSGATHTTAETIRPSFELVKTRPGVSIVSSVFLMCLADRVLVYGDCAVNPNPNAEQLADIAISSAATASQFGIEPRVAMLSYSTGASGAGAEVEAVREATELVRSRAPGLSVEGPIQYDAAVDAGVARTKLPDSDVAGRATVFIFPDLNTGNNTYKAVQRSANAIAIGPVLQGLNKPVNDLSRGATVHDIVNTVAITAIQASS
ncbi:phosphate acetyltransferase [Solirubrobacter ginsenosidimutans]|uniref:Phosphate acetyltransferase n=1 Tax=Solirubrobacter ginsenosidimutans TaxID=490573 RepID=A0A9X3MWG9_9ACTN|nr:phosphate acetyltransferase [Solirubrobacter ginsenosidimutans]MDA0163031.1 phosphate acetyltransferase [Solirubrobacter ginsenosidimutans]